MKSYRARGQLVTQFLRTLNESRTFKRSGPIIGNIDTVRGLACLLLVLACAGPRRPDLRTRLPAEGIAIMMAIDVSGSMATPDVLWNPGSPPVSRLDAAKNSFKLFVGGGEAPDGTNFEPRPGDSIGLVKFAAVPQTANRLVDAMKAADAALYEAKRAGRNRVVAADGRAAQKKLEIVRAAPGE